MTREALFGFSVFMVAFTVVLILTASPLLVRPIVPGANFPLGNLIIWIGLISLPLAIYTGIEKLYRPKTRIQKGFRTIILIILLLNAAWGFVGYYLSGNWAFNFTNDPQSSIRYWNYIYFIVLSPLVFLLAYGIYSLIRHFRKSVGNEGN
ncbi:MAG: hypothetical protein H6558_07515 [Lewinellaceae bacterium]|nr:hypothetical protein [Lewinellaceae bacterium]